MKFVAGFVMSAFISQVALAYHADSNGDRVYKSPTSSTQTAGVDTATPPVDETPKLPSPDSVVAH